MAYRDIKGRKLRKISVGDMRECISIEERKMTAPSFGSASFTENYVPTDEVWAKIETSFNNRIFDGVALDEIPSHKFTIRHRDDVTSETRIRYDGVLYRIVKTDNYEMRNEYLELYALIDGDDTKEANQ